MRFVTLFCFLSLSFSPLNFTPAVAFENDVEKLQQTLASISDQQPTASKEQKEQLELGKKTIRELCHEQPRIGTFRYDHNRVVPLLIETYDRFDVQQNGQWVELQVEIVACLSAYVRSRGVYQNVASSIKKFYYRLTEAALIFLEKSENVNLEDQLLRNDFADNANRQDVRWAMEWLGITKETTLSKEAVAFHLINGLVGTDAHPAKAYLQGFIDQQGSTQISDHAEDALTRFDQEKAAENVYFDNQGQIKIWAK